MEKDEIYEYDNSRYEEFFQEAIKSQKEIEKYRKTSAYQNYISICKRTAKLIKKLASDFQDDRMYMAIFVYLYRNGYLSANKHFEFGDDNDEIGCNLGLSVISGKGVCRNVASLFKDILKAIKDEKNGIMMVGTNVSEERNSFIPMNELPKEFSMNHATSTRSGTQNRKKHKFIPTHAEVIVMNKDDKTYSFMLYDPTNIRITRINYSSTVSERRAIDFRCGIWDINTHLSTLEERKAFINKFGKIAQKIETSKREEYTKEDLKLILEFARRQCNANKDKIEELYKDNKMWYSIMKEQKENFFKELNEGKGNEER